MRPNNFDLARLLLATMVVFFHTSILSHSPALRMLKHLNPQNIAVEGFFVISGLLIVGSYERCKSLGEYFSKRARRIIPGYLLSTALCLLVAISFTHAFHVGKFLIANLTFMNFLHPSVVGVFTNNPENSFLNGSLWTIKIEVMFYLSVPLLVWFCRRFGRVQVLVSCIVLSIIYRHVMHGRSSLAVQLPGQMSFFGIGALVYYYLPKFRQYGRWLILPAFALYALHLYTGYYFLRPFSVSVIVLGFCLLLPDIEGPTKTMDLSYGTYVLHYPIVQTLVAVGLFQWSPWLGVLTTFILVGISASFSWFMVERRWLQRKQITSAPTAEEKPLARVQHAW